MESQIPFLELVLIVKRNFKVIFTVFMIVVVITLGITLSMPEWYRAQTTILPPSDEVDMFNFSSLMNDLPLKALGLGSGSGELDLIIAMLKSRSVMEVASKEYNLQQRYKTKNLEETVKELRKHVAIRADEEGTLTFFVEAKSSWFPIFLPNNRENARLLARDMTNYFIQEVDKINKNLKTDRARNVRIFVEKRYLRNSDDLSEAEDSLKKFQIDHGAIAIPEQMTATLSAAAELKAQIVAKEVEIGVVRNIYGVSHLEYLKNEIELIELSKMYKDIYEGDPFSKNKDSQDNLFLPLKDMPYLGLQYARLLREVLIQEKIMEFLLPQYEQAKIQETKDTPTLQVLDPAVKPERKHRPKRAIIVAFYSLFSMIFSITYYYSKPTLKQYLQILKSS